MIVRLTGTLIEVTEESVIIERDGIAREVLVPIFAIAELAAHRGQEVMLHTQEFLEGSHTSGHLTPRLLGFLHPEDRLFFSRFISVKGIGPRKALKALCEPVRRVASWITNGDAKALSTLPGVGKRSAELIVASLKGKVDDFSIGGADGVTGSVASKLTEPQRDAMEVLVAWGDTRNDAQRWLERAAQIEPDIQQPDEWVRAAYKVKTGVAG